MPIRAADRSASSPTGTQSVLLQNAYSSFTSSIIADTAVFRWTRGSRSPRHALDRFVRLPPERALGLIQLDVRRRSGSPRRRSCRRAIDQTPDAREEPEAALEPCVRPLDLFLRRRHEHHVEPQRVGAELLDHVVGIDDVALRLRHDLAGLEDHALRQQPGEGLVEMRHARDRGTRA